MRRTWQPTPVFLRGESHGQRSLEGYSAQGRKEADMTEHLTQSLLSSALLLSRIPSLLNHLQIVDGLMELEEYDEMNSYLRKVYKELLKTGKAVKTSKPAINALLAAKMAEAEAQKIEFQVDVKSDLKKLCIEDWELCKVLSNLIDNAMKALEDFEGEEKKIRVQITETPERYIFSVDDNGPKIPENIRENIFKKGFSTKKEEGHGMGLAIVSEILNKNRGDIELSSDDEETVFTVSFGKGE